MWLEGSSNKISSFVKTRGYFLPGVQNRIKGEIEYPGMNKKMTTWVAHVCSVIAILTTFVYFSFSAYQTRKSALSKSHGSATQFIPILATFVNTLFWFKYGFILGDVTMSVVNGFGLILSMYSAIIYHHHTAHRFSCQVMSIVGLSGVIFWLVSISQGWLKLEGIGFSAMSTSVCMYSAPLSALFGILKRHFGSEELDPKVLLNRKKTSIWVPREGLSLGMIIVSLAVSGSWAAYGLSIQDKYVVIPNVLGMIMSTIQYFVWLICYPSVTMASVAFSNNSSATESTLTFKQEQHYERPFSPVRDPLLKKPPTTSTAIEMRSF